MNQGTVLTAVGVIITAVLTFLGGYFAKKGDRNAKMTQRYFDDAEFNINMVGALRRDYWGLYRILNVVSVKWHTLVEGLPTVCTTDHDEMARLMARVGEFPEIPVPEHIAIERSHLEQIERENKENEKK